MPWNYGKKTPSENESDNRSQTQHKSTRNQYASQQTGQHAQSSKLASGNTNFYPDASAESKRRTQESQELSEWKKHIENKIQQLEFKHDDYITKHIQLETKLLEITTKLTNDHSQRISQFSNEVVKCQQDFAELTQAVHRNQSRITQIEENQSDVQQKEYKHKRENHVENITNLPTFKEQAKQSVIETQRTRNIEVPVTSKFIPPEQGTVLSASGLLRHVGFVGAAGTGKSSLINAIRGLKPSQTGAALVDDMPIEKVEKYEFQQHDGCLVLCEIPNMEDSINEVEQYFEDYKLEQLNLLIIVFAERFMETDAMMTKFADEHQLSYILVRTKSDRAIESKVEQKGLSQHQAVAELREQTRATTMSKLNIVGIGKDSTPDIYCVSTRGFVGTPEQQEMFIMDEDFIRKTLAH